jgi:hypothetical protein
MLNMNVVLTLKESPPDATKKKRKIIGYFQFLSVELVPVGPLMMTDPYDWNEWSEWLSSDIEERSLVQTGGMLHPTASAQLGPVSLRVPNRTPFYLKGDDDALANK